MTYPLMGRVRAVVAVVVKVVLNAPDVVKLPPNVMVFVPLLTPVPPLVPISVPLSVRVPEAVIGPPVNVMPVVPPEASTLVTVPAPEIVLHEGSALAPPV